MGAALYPRLKHHLQFLRTGSNVLAAVKVGSEHDSRDSERVS
jgi:hypothetical protein